jgi:hypothetical protein
MVGEGDLATREGIICVLLAVAFSKTLQVLVLIDNTDWKGLFRPLLAVFPTFSAPI